MDDINDVLHSHSGLERTLVISKSKVIVDAKFRNLFPLESIDPFTYDGVQYVLVPTLLFVKMNGVFKNLDK